MCTSCYHKCNVGLPNQFPKMFFVATKTCSNTDNPSSSCKL